MSETRFIQPLDVLFLRDNHLFGAAAGDAARAMMPPWPSVFAGALRSRMLADAGASIAALEKNTLPEPIGTILGTPDRPGSFTLGAVTLARQINGRTERFHPLPADLTVSEAEECLRIRKLAPQTVPETLVTSAHSAGPLPVMRTDQPAKPLAGYWLTAVGWERYLRGAPLDPATHLCAQADLWRLESRLGIALDADRGAAAESQLYTSDAVALRPNTGFVVEVHGADGHLPGGGLLRLGGDGRGASVDAVTDAPVGAPDWDAIADTGRFRLILTSPGLFPDGHQPPDIAADGAWRRDGASARLVCHTLARAQVISGWDMAAHRPKPAQRFAPTGSVYWFEGFDGDIEALQKLSETGLWHSGQDNDNTQRRAEGFNRVAVANA